MSEGPIKRERDAWKPRKASTTDAERVDCEAARRADLQATRKGK